MSVLLCAQVTEMLLKEYVVKNILTKGRRPVYYTENQKIQETERLLEPLLLMGTQ